MRRDETIRDAYHDTMEQRRYRQQVQLDTHYFNFNDTIVNFTTSALILLEARTLGLDFTDDYLSVHCLESEENSKGTHQYA